MTLLLRGVAFNVVSIKGTYNFWLMYSVVVACIGLGFSIATFIHTSQFVCCNKD